MLCLFIIRFVEKNSDESGYVVKMPYTTNSEFVKFARDYTQVLQHIELAARKYAERVEYVMVQPCMKNRKEYRVVVLGGRAQYLADVQQKACGSATRQFSEHPHGALFGFAENAVLALRTYCPESISDYVMRVDIFQRSDNRLVVNEFESLEACVYHKDSAVAISWMGEYLYNKLHSFIVNKSK